ncbi:Glyoxylase, beta-lactamase superfamily II [Noviherbaspirillum humi]|uniref:Glyoxylase, beta-lactamase superfamily II n=2 Tax=Noviherbaspirillum humi TaxID=1688639 RepID=A0A239KBS8_9BURK|nr:Glyoxylase, beta-lactamase superfamily II [Noviherbaspirillum humi]
MTKHGILGSLFAIAVHGGNAIGGELQVFTSDQAGFNTHSIWYDDGQEVTVVDTQFTPAHAESLLAEIRRQTKSPVTRVIVTHPNPDKFNALSVFHQAGAESIASVRTAAAMPGVDAYKRYFWVKIAKAFTDETYPKLEPVKTTYSGNKVITLRSGETITLFELPQPGVSSNQTVVRIDKSGDLIVGDLIHARNHAWLEGGIVDGKPVPSLAGWKSDLQELLKLGQGKAYGGRGAFLPVPKAVAQQTAYLDKADAIVGAYIRRLGDKAPELVDPAKQGAHHAAIQAEFVKAFPDYAMPDLIGYSIYGLVQQKLGN